MNMLISEQLKHESCPLHQASGAAHGHGAKYLPGSHEVEGVDLFSRGLSEWTLRGGLSISFLLDTESQR